MRADLEGDVVEGERMGVGVCPDILAWAKEKEESQPDQVGESGFAGAVARPLLNLEEGGFRNLWLFGLGSIALLVAGRLPVEAEVEPAGAGVLAVVTGPQFG